MGNYKQDKPWSMQLEVTWGCNRRCWFCGIHDTPHAPRAGYRFMDVDLVREVGRQCNAWKPNMRMEFGTGGEPPMHPRFFDVVDALRTTCPKMQIMVQTNVESWATSGDAARAWIAEWFGRGGNFLVLNCYKVGLKAQMEEWLAGTPWEAIDFYGNNPDHRSMYHYVSPKAQTIFICEDLGLMTLQGATAKVPQRWINNQGGGTPDAAMERAGVEVHAAPLERRCTMPFRQLVLSWDGRAPLCCYDWTDRLVVGKFPEQSLQEIWNGRPMQLARFLLYRSKRTFLPCATCDFHGGFRFGFMQDAEIATTVEAAEQELRRLTAEQAKTFEPWQAASVKRWADRIPLPLVDGGGADG